MSLLHNILLTACTATCVLISSVLLTASQVQAQDVWSEQTPLIKQAESFLVLLDHKALQQAWERTSPLFKALNDKEQWQNEVGTIRTVYGSPIKRSYRLHKFRNAYTHSPDGKYAIIQFFVSFEEKADSLETVVLSCSDEEHCSIRDYTIR